MVETNNNRVGAGVPSQSTIAGMPNSPPTTVGEKAQEVLAGVGHRVQDTASNLAQEARQAASTVSSKAEGAINSVGEGMSALAGTVRDKVPRESTLGSTAGVVADQLDAAGSYLQQHDLSDMGKDLTAVVRKYPVPAFFAALGVGLLLGRTRR